jgi:chromosome segregation ATPase
MPPVETDVPQGVQPDRGELRRQEFRRRRRRRLIPIALLVLSILLSALGMAGYLAYSNKSRADRWQTRAAGLDRNVKALNYILVRRTNTLGKRNRQLNQMAATVAAAQGKLSSSEAVVQTLEERQRQLANEKAQVEDQRQQLVAEKAALAADRDALATQASTLVDVASAVVDCKSWLQDAVQAASSQNSTWFDVNGSALDSSCNDADRRVSDYNATYAGG